MVEMEVVGVAPEPNSNKPLVWLKDKEQRVFLPIAIGNFEATAIYMELYNEPPPRPISYDLLRSVLEGVDATVTRVEISDLREDTFFAKVIVEHSDTTLTIDSRPSDAIALALRVSAPILASETVLKEAGLSVEQHSEEALGLVLDGDAEEGLVNSPEGLIDEPSGRPVAHLDSKVITLKERLKEAVEKEAYEEAAELRDEIGRLEQSGDD